MGSVRLPRPAPGRAPIWIVATLGLVILTAGAMWWGLAATVDKPNWIEVAWNVKDDRTIDVTYQVSKPQGMTVRCTIEAQAEDHSVAGAADVLIGPQEARETRHTTTLRTTVRAVRGGIKTCREVTPE